ncbi:hypothetical protein ABMY44_03380 [Pseudoalteromonas sp. Cnat2-41]|uniref:hypothetical protein n=1 Tax=unclassified Pseudoalteromonas TaxID=194690 RepID=UPI001EF824E4|nr:MULTISPECIES: hypothetical protein [unclassified Pseudoalteromonas]MCF2861207.1 hypothetical protein [Pseudoalteromonas sp. CNAT2-18]MCG7557076.1 hypothetical protein [Pseudoalteromonas sp. CNAT2-18.1]
MHYKYRSLENFKNFVDIILNNRIYAAPYFELNDPMEGLYTYDAGTINRELVEKIKGEKTKLRICSLSRRPDSTLMWSHYADSHRGVVIGLVVDNKHEMRPITYEGLSYVQNATRNGSHETAKNVLTCKLEPWAYEEEERVFVTDSNYVDISISQILLGSKMDTRTKSLVRNLVNKLNPNIEVHEANVAEIV